MANETEAQKTAANARPTPPWERGRARKAKAPAKAPLTQESIVDAAMRVLDTEGFDALSMRRVAAELDTGPASLYAHVANKDELLSLMIDRAIGAWEFPEPDPERWQEQLKDVLRGQRRIYQEHPGMARVMLGHIPLGPNGLHTVEGFLALGRAGNLPDKAIAWGADIISLYVTAAAFEDDIRQRSNPDFSEEKLEAWLDELKAYIATLPKDKFPNLTSMTDTLFESGGADGRFEFGMDLLIRGLASYAQENAEKNAEMNPKPAQ